MGALMTKSSKENALTLELRRQNRVIFENERLVKIRCPFSGDGELEHHAFYVKPSKYSAYGAFYCRHCQSRTLSDLLLSLKLEQYELRPITKIHVDEFPLFELIQRVEKVLAETGQFFVAGQNIVRVTENSDVALNPAEATKILSSLIAFLRKDRRSNPPRIKEIDPPSKLVRVLCASSEHEHLKKLLGVTRHPLLTESGLLKLQAGFDANTHVFASFPICEYQKLAFSSVSFEAARDALKEVLRWLDEFQFDENKDKSAAMAALLTGVFRHEFISAPMFVVTAANAGSGKSTLCEMIGAIASGRHIASSTWPVNEEEISRLLLSQLRTGASVIYFDNVEGVVRAYPSICTCLTQSRFVGRELGRSSVINVATRALFLMSGNFLSIDADLRRRTLPILLAGLEKPEERIFKHENLIQEVLAQRASIVMNLLKIVAAFRQHNPKGIDLKPLAGFPEWSQTCRAPLIWLGMPDPIERVFENLAVEDTDRSARYTLLAGLKEIFDTRKFRTRDIALLVESNNASLDLIQALEELEYLDHKHLNLRRLGWGLAQLQNQAIKGLVLQRVGPKSEYRVVSSKLHNKKQ